MVKEFGFAGPRQIDAGSTRDNTARRFAGRAVGFFLSLGQKL
jgi:hypothetical protein